MGENDVMALGALGLLALALVVASLSSRWVARWGIVLPSGRLAPSPHGDLNAVRVVEGPCEPRRLALFARCLLASEAVAGTLVAMELFLSAMPAPSAAVTGIAFVGMFAAMAVAYPSLGLRQVLLYGFAGYLLFGALSMALVGALYYALDLSGPLLFALANTVPVAATSLGLALAPRRLRFERAFEDGHVDRIWVSARSRAFEPLSERATGSRL